LLTGTVRIAKGDDGGGNRRTTSLIGAVADTVAKVLVLAEASGIGGGASKGWSQGEHVVDAGLLEGKGQPLHLRSTCFLRRRCHWTPGRHDATGRRDGEEDADVSRSTYTAGGEVGDLGNSGQGECADGDHDCGLHLDRIEVRRMLAGVAKRVQDAGTKRDGVVCLGRRREDSWGRWMEGGEVGLALFRSERRSDGLALVFDHQRNEVTMLQFTPATRSDWLHRQGNPN
jgi:hypothetical protein